MFLSLVGVVSVCAKFQRPSLSRSRPKVPGGVVGCSGVGCSVVGCSVVVKAHFSVQLKPRPS